jgi:predicted RNA-binding Zn-ribbon protein involved in translation (DUF1610 family)
MSTSAAHVETAFSFLELLAQAGYEREELDEVLSDYPIAPKVAKLWDETERVLSIANATWVGRIVDSDLLAVIERHLEETPLTVRRNAFAGTVTLATPGVLGGLKDKVAKEQRESEEATQGRYSSVQPDTWRAMMREGLVDWTVRTAADQDYEVRRCTSCGKWFEPQLKSRSRFCSPKCRKEFNNLRNSGREDVTSFLCAGCGETRSMDDFAGLRFASDEDKTATNLRMGRYTRGGDDMCCVECVRTKYPEWRRYIAPMESLSERPA